MSQALRVVFMGTPDFAVGSLKSLIDNNINVIGVITAPDKPAGRGKKLQMSAVKKFALENNISNILQPSNLKDNAFLGELQALNADLFVVVAFRMLPEVVWDMPEYGTINLHASLLPHYRGAAPINWAIINGDTETGVTTFFIEKEIDTGKVIMQQKMEILPADNAGSLHDKLMELGANTLVKTVAKIENNDAEAIAQDSMFSNTELKMAPKIFKDDCKINWEQSTSNVFNFIRGLSPYPAAWTELQLESGEYISAKIYSAEIETNEISLSVGNVQLSNKALLIGCNDGVLSIKEIHMAGKKRMDIRSFINGLSDKHKFTSVNSQNSRR